MSTDVDLLLKIIVKKKCSEISFEIYRVASILWLWTKESKCGLRVSYAKYKQKTKKTYWKQNLSEKQSTMDVLCALWIENVSLKISLQSLHKQI